MRANPAQERNTGESHQGWRDHFRDTGFGPHRLEENLPAQGAHEVADIDQQDAMKNVPFINAMSLAPERAPIEGPPMSVLQVNQNGEDEEHDNAGQNAFSIHLGENSASPSLPHEAGNGTTQGK
jgi:hypothetical protein